ncbi:L-idonate 5-dehydrogenase [Microbacterium sp. NPDC056044]|uniref:L-idonate 5-dehydrogenase n=1 Tax=Microbacterium sp. NPDC056044 TaxID=3345690 RepID=UPI0035DB0167
MSSEHPNPGAPALRTRALVVHAANDVRIDEVAAPDPAPDEAVLRIAYGGICGSDLHYWKHGAAGQSILRAPMVLGHEVVGVVETPAADGTGPAQGTPVAVHPATYGESPQRFPEARPNISGGVSYLGSAARFPHKDGGFADRIALPVSMLRPLPASLPLRTAALIEPASVAWHAVGRAGTVAGKRVLVVGSGPIGALIVAVAAAQGASEIIAVDVQPYALQVAERVGATRTLLASQADEIAAADADIVFESSGNPRGVASALSAATRGGRVVLVGLLPDGDVSVPLATAITRELDVVGSFRFHDEIDSVIAALADGSLQIDAVVSHEYPLDEALDALAVAADSGSSSKVLLRF